MITSKTPHIELFGSGEIVVDDCRGILEYENCTVKLNISKGLLIISGRGLSLGYMADDSVRITGMIKSVEFN